jgi:hypothetical protein
MTLYAALLPSLGPVGAPAALVGAAVVLLLLAWLAIALRSRGGGGSHRPGEEASLIDRVVQIARERPGLAAGVALAAGLIALKNPRLVAGLTSAFLAGKAADRAEHRRRW